MMTEYLSKKLRWLSILMTILVVVIHAFNFAFLTNRYSPAINHFFFAPSIDIGRTAVPLFFLISGILFFKDGAAFTLVWYKSQVMKRVRTVLIPFLLMSAIFIFLVWLSYRDFVPSYLHLNYLLPEYSAKSILEGWILKPQAYYLWFLRNLFALTLFSPIIYWVAKKGGLYVIVPAIIAWICLPEQLPSATLSIIFFTLGAWISISKVELPQKVSPKYLIILSLLWLTFVVLSKFEAQFYYLYIMAFYNVYTLFGIVIAWLSYDYISPKFINRINSSLLAQYIFSIYLFHHAFLILFEQTWIHFAGRNTVEVILPMYYISIPLSIVLSMAVAIALQKLAPPFYRLLTGSR